jgi:poly(3-hydroxybutyrate) depolymerase
MMRVKRYVGILVTALLAAILADYSFAGEPLEPRWKVVTPEDYDAARSYPLYVVLHGANSYLEDMIPYFKLDKHEGEYILAFIQSTERARYRGFTWYLDIEKGREEIRRCYEEIVEGYPIDTERVILGGFSAGATMAIDVVLNEIIPAIGFVTGCPAMPRSFSSDKVEAAVRRGVRGVMIAGRDDYYLERQLQMAEAFDVAGFEYRHILISGLGHDYPEDFPRRLDLALEFVDPAVLK